MEILGGIVTAYIGIVIISILLSTFFMWLGAKVTNVKKADFINSLIAAVGASVVTGLVSWAFAGFAGVGAAVGYLLGLALSVVVIKAAYDIDYSKALIIWIFHLIATIIAIFVAVATFADALLTILK